jgi:exopolysaccharide biosynthesis protein
MRNARKKKLLPGWLIVLLDIVALGVALCVFALFHHVLPKYGKGPIRSIVTVQDPSGAAKASPSANPNSVSNAAAPAAESTQAPGDFSAAFPSEDTGAGADFSHQSENVRVSLKKVSADNITYYVADVWVKNISYLRTAFANGQYGQGVNQSVMTMAKSNKAIVAISGDYYGARAKGVVVRNGQLYRDTAFEDVCVLYEDGVMQTYTKDEFQIDEAVERKAYQIWGFGPQLLRGGKPLTEFNSSVTSANPRCAIGYYEPGHYCFVLVDGRQPGYSDGITMEGLSKLFYDLGCKDAYNLDGGQTAMMAFGDQLVNHPFGGGRHSSDIIYICEDA